MLSPPSSAQFFTSHCIDFSAARFLSQQGASLFLQLHRRHPFHALTPQVLHNSAQFFTSHCIVFSAARFLSQQGVSFFLQLHHRHSFHALTPKFCTLLHLLTASFSPLLDFCLNKVLVSFFSSIIVIPFMLSPPSSAHFFTSHCIVFYAARFLSQQGASFFLSFFLQLHHHHPFHALTPKFCTILVLFLTLFFSIWQA